MLLAFLGAWFALGYVTNGTLAFLSGLMISDLPFVPALLGALAGALLLNLSLWVIDFFSPAAGDEEIETADAED